MIQKHVKVNALMEIVVVIRVNLYHFQPAYEIDIANVAEVPKGYVCVRALPCVQHYYKSKAKKNYIVIRRSNPDTFSVTDLVNELIKRKIIHL